MSTTKIKCCRTCGKPMKGHCKIQCDADHPEGFARLEVTRFVLVESYDRIVAIIRASAQECFTSAAPREHGRTQSANAETSCLISLRDAIASKNSRLRVEIPSRDDDRSWWDFRVENIPFNLKLTSGQSADNALNKQGITCSITGHTHQPKTRSWQQFHDTLASTPWLAQHQRETEYHYPAISKTSGFLCLKSIFDIWSYIPNGNLANVLQINWKREMEHPELTADDQFQKKTQQLIETIQRAIRIAIASVQDIAHFNVAAKFPQPNVSDQS